MCYRINVNLSTVSISELFDAVRYEREHSFFLNCVIEGTLIYNNSQFIWICVTLISVVVTGLIAYIKSPNCYISLINLLRSLALLLIIVPLCKTNCRNICRRSEGWMKAKRLIIYVDVTCCSSLMDSQVQVYGSSVLAVDHFNGPRPVKYSL